MDSGEDLFIKKTGNRTFCIQVDSETKYGIETKCLLVTIYEHEDNKASIIVLDIKGCEHEPITDRLYFEAEIEDDCYIVTRYLDITEDLDTDDEYLDEDFDDDNYFDEDYLDEEDIDDDDFDENYLEDDDYLDDDFDEDYTEVLTNLSIDKNVVYSKHNNMVAVEKSDVDDIESYPYLDESCESYDHIMNGIHIMQLIAGVINTKT